jgi:DNA-binding beta-propeller fold protein YncE
MGRFTIAQWLLGLACAVALSGMVCAGLVLAPPASASDMVYWGNYDGSTISFAKLDGSGGGDLLTTLGDPDGLAIDSATDKIYWVEHFTDKVFFANLDGSASGSLTTTGVTPEDPVGLAIDPTTEEIYWGNEGNDTISFAKLAGSGGGTLNTAPVTPFIRYSSPFGGELTVRERDLNV